MKWCKESIEVQKAITDFVIRVANDKEATPAELAAFAEIAKGILKG